MTRTWYTLLEVIQMQWGPGVINQNNVFWKTRPVGQQCSTTIGTWSIFDQHIHIGMA